KVKCEVLVSENDGLGKAQAKASHDKQDIVEFLNIKVGEHEKHINGLEERAVQLEVEKQELAKRTQRDLDAAVGEGHKEIEALQQQCAVYKNQLSDLHIFAARKDELEQQLTYLKGQLDAKERTYKETVHNIERKVLQDKNLLKREMLQKVNEAVANFQRVADQQMAETTKRAIRENMMITSQLKKMSGKTMELIAENDSLKQKVARLKMTNSVLTDSEQTLAKKNQTHQRVIKTLIEKLKGATTRFDHVLPIVQELISSSSDICKILESDEMLEVAYEGVSVDGEGNIAYKDEERDLAPNDRFHIFGSDNNSSNDAGDTEHATPSSLMPNFVEVCNTFDEMAEFWETHQEASPDSTSESMSGFIDK
ncbi:hypothetical protein HKX48_001670, partial [Thoreauomyces humboldtii]